MNENESSDAFNLKMKIQSPILILTLINFDYISAYFYAFLIK